MAIYRYIDSAQLPPGFPLSRYYTSPPAGVPLPTKIFLSATVATGEPATLKFGVGNSQRSYKFHELQRRLPGATTWEYLAWPSARVYYDTIPGDTTKERSAEYRGRIWENFGSSKYPRGTFPGWWSDIIKVTVPPATSTDPPPPTEPPPPIEPPPAATTFSWTEALAAARLGTPMRRQSWGNSKWLEFEAGDGDEPAVCVLVQRTTATVNGVLQSTITRRPLSAGDFGRSDYEADDWVEAK